MAPQYAAASGGAGHRLDVRITGHRPAGQPSAWERDTEGIGTPAKACDFHGRGSRVLSGSKKVASLIADGSLVEMIEDTLGRLE